MSEAKVQPRSPASFEDEYILAVNSKYGIDMTKSTTKNMGAMKTKPAKSQEPYASGKSPEKLNGQLPQSTQSSMVNGSIKLKDEAMASKHTTGSIKPRARNRKKRAYESDSDEEVVFNKKRRKVDDISHRLRGSDSKDNVANSPVCKEDSAVLKTKSALCDDDKGQHLDTSPVKDSNDIQRPVDTVQNYKNLSLSEIYTSVLKESASDTSPFKGKMSAFEISLLKGRQSMERRKSMEAAALRSSPRNNTNIPKPDYAERKRRQRTNSLPQTGVEKKRARKPAAGPNKPLRIRTSRTCKDSKALSAVSPSSIENRFVEQNVRVRKKRKVSESKSSTDLPANSPKVSDSQHETCESDSKPSSPSKNSNFAYRMNGSSPKLKDMPSVLSLNSLSGIPQKIQGSSFSSCHSALRSDQLSGTPQALPQSTTSSTTTAAALCVDSSGKVRSPRPETLPVASSPTIPETNNLPSGSTEETTDDAAAAKDSSDKSSVCGGKTRSRRMTLEETVNMLRKSATSDSGHKLSEGQNPGSKVSSSVSSLSDGKRSRRSSRSSTPSMSPMKPDILTPSCTPVSTPCKSPRSSPSRAYCKNQKLNKKRKHLFVKNDDVLARWHDGLFYSGKILKIDENNSKCLLRYEDNSEFWSLFKDIHRVAKEEEMICCICYGETSEPPDEIVLCDNCCQGYHQKCHSPNITSREIVDPDDEWFCRECVFLMSVKVGGAVRDGKTGEDLNKMKQSLPYAVERLTWDMQHKNNIEQCYCYCGGPGIWYQKMLQCCRCKQWFHEACMQCTSFPIMFGDSFYIFVCTKCNFGNEFIRRVDVEWQDLLHIALFNLVMNHKQRLFHFTNELMPWLEQNWKDLQIPQYDHLNEEERVTFCRDNLRSNKTRFVCGDEMHKNTQLWGLRIRVPPPRIFITLPVSCKVSEDIMKKLKIKGRRSKVFIPMECKSPVNNLRHSPLNPNTMMRKRLDIISQGSTVHITSQGKCLTPKCKPPRVKLPLLDRLIPKQNCYSLHDHPFMTKIEQETFREEMQHRDEIWLKYQSMSSGSNAQTEDPPILEKVEPISPSTSNSSTPPMPEISKKKRSKKSVQSKAESKDNTPGSRRSRRVSLKTNAPPELTDILASKSDISVKKVKASGDNYFCAFDKTGYGKGFFINGKRMGPYGQMEYLVNWDM